ncbi:MAG TPA: asparagine synthase (glutamine-hydrolyzing), partial [Candidatus Hodarchaeales archaeon]|nr:asparagine synthase (glutamine-hydrolyzing) [Candidatus Hodarchaeales archaeon]
MCGLCGVVTFNNSLAQQHILSMNASLIHRGPDDEGYLLGDFNSGRSVQASGSDTPSDLELNPIVDYRNGDFNLALGFRRLSIIDLSPKGHGPMSYANQNFWIVFNGEIYNYIEIRRELSSLGYIFDSNTDTEVILAAYAEWGVECLQHFNGMWAFAIWNVRERKLFCARDRFGIKPFNYFWDGKLFAFASEAKALFQHPSINPQSNDKVVFDYLVYGSQNHGSETFFHGIETVPASHYLELDLARGQVQIQKWWDIELNSERVSSNEKGDARVKTQFRELLTDSIRLRLRSDVPIGSSLSGGLDSSAVVGIVNQLLREEQLLPKDLIGEHQQTFSACFEDGDINER